MNEEIKQEINKPKLWNPNSAALWCLLFSIAFGAFLHAINWEEMGMKDKARTNKIWGWSIIVLLLLSLFLPYLGKFISLIMVVLIFVWYFSQGGKQIKFVKEKYQNDYERKSWTKPLLIATGCFIGFIILNVILGVIFCFFTNK